MAESSYDCMVIGSGPGGYVAALRAAQLGKRTAVVERDKIGGRCLNYACIPAKAVLRSADLLTEVREGADFGIRADSIEIDYAAIQARRDKVVNTLTSGVAMLFRKHGIDVLEGSGSLQPDGSVSVDGQSYAAQGVVVATGSIPRPIPGAQFGGRVVGTEEAWAFPEVPARLAVVGAGASGTEIASAFARLGSEVLLLEALERVLPTEDADVSRLVDRGLKRQGVQVHTATPVAEVSPEEQTVSFSYGEERAEVDYLVIAAGRGADVEGLGLGEAGVELDERGLVKVDGALRTTRAGVWAIGDLVSGPALAHKASDEGIMAVEDMSGMPTHPIAHLDIPRATFCMPNVGSFGLTEEQAREEGYEVVVGKVPYGAVGGGTVYGDRTGMVKVVGDRAYGELLGGHIVGARATEMIQELVNIRALEGGFPELGRIIHGHPTLSEAVMEAGRAADGWLIHG
ncbi:MAG TPA: dihydrolipoyl dehydrogenase [Solirubrobacteraceae bacterium]|nr:dihydrolipoyl dehydrogenase [Solirubrobacteraceae bacterium]